MNNNGQKNIEEIVKELGIKTTEYWINQLKTLEPHQIGVIKISGKLLEGSSLKQLSAEIAYLSNKAGFYLPLVLGGGVQYDKLCNGSKKVNGLRITSKSLINQIVHSSFVNQGKIVNQLQNSGVDAEAINPGNIIVQPHGCEIENGEKIDTGYVGDVVSINTAPIIKAIIEKKVPVLTHIGYYNNEPYNINATTVAKDLVRFLQTRKLIIVGDTPVLDHDGKIIKNIGSELEFKNLVNSGIVQGGMINNVEEAYKLLNYLGPGHSVQITSLKKKKKVIESTGFLEELLTTEGSGTKIDIPSIITAKPLLENDKPILYDLINNAFSAKNKKLVENYFDTISSKGATVYLDETKNGGAITYPLDSFEYICKLFVKKGYEGLGIAKSLINNIYLQKKKVAWRFCKDNENGNGFYNDIINKYGGFSADVNDYVVYCVGIPYNQKPYIAKMISEIPPTLEAIK